MVLKRVIFHSVYLIIIMILLFVVRVHTIFDGGSDDVFFGAWIYRTCPERFEEFASENVAIINEIQRKNAGYDFGEKLYDDCPLLSEWAMKAVYDVYLIPHVKILINHGADVESARRWLVAHDKGRAVLLLEKLNEGIPADEIQEWLERPEEVPAELLSAEEKKMRVFFE